MSFVHLFYIGLLSVISFVQHTEICSLNLPHIVAVRQKSLKSVHCLHMLWLLLEDDIRNTNSSICKFCAGQVSVIYYFGQITFLHAEYILLSGKSEALTTCFNQTDCLYGSHFEFLNSTSSEQKEYTGVSTSYFDFP